MSKGSATALILIALALAAIAAGGYVAITGANVFEDTLGQSADITPTGVPPGPELPVFLCTGTHKACTNYGYDAATCARHGCSVSGGFIPTCVGTPHTCEADTTQVNCVAGGCTWTGAVTYPTIVSTSPTGTNVPVDTSQITVSFSKDMYQGGHPGEFFSTDPRIGMGVYKWENSRTLSFSPSYDFEFGATYTVTVNTSARDTANNYLEEPYSWQFTTTEIVPVYTLTIQKSGTGDGIIVIDPPGVSPITFPNEWTYDSGTAVTITVDPDENTVLAWEGCDSISENSCIINMTEDRTVDITLATAVELTVEPTSQKGEPGDTLNYVAKITNNRGEDLTFIFTIACPTTPDKLVCSPNSTQVGIGNGDTKSIPFTIKSPVNATYKNYSITARAYDKLSPEFDSSVQFNDIVGICSREAPEITSNPSSISGPPGSRRNFNITINNNDECIGYFNYSVICPEDWNCTLSKASSSIAVDKSDYINLSVTPADDAGINTTYTVNFTATNTKATPIQRSSKGLKYQIIKCTDIDRDAYYSEGGSCGAKDCNDADASIHPGAVEYCLSSIDRDCDGTLGKNEPSCDKNGSVLDQMTAKYEVGDKKCSSELGENIVNSPSDCASVSAGPAVCGNDKVETGENCDGTSDSACPGVCSYGCKCPYLVGDDICESAAGESSATSADCRKTGGTGIALGAIGILAALGVGMYYYWRRGGKFGNLLSAHGIRTATPGVDLDTAVNSMLSEGYKPAEIHSNLEASGWSHSRVDSAFESAQADQEALGKMAEQQGVAAPTEKAKASKYVKKCIEQGYDPTQIRTALMSSGWPASAVDGMISKQTAKHLQAHADKAGVGEPTEAHKEDLSGYIKKELSEGHTKQSIKKVLEDAGWSSSDVNKAFKE